MAMLGVIAAAFEGASRAVDEAEDRRIRRAQLEIEKQRAEDDHKRIEEFLRRSEQESRVMDSEERRAQASQQLQGLKFLQSNLEPQMEVLRERKGALEALGQDVSGIDQQLERLMKQSSLLDRVAARTLIGGVSGGTGKRPIPETTTTKRGREVEFSGPPMALRDPKRSMAPGAAETEAVSKVSPSTVPTSPEAAVSAAPGAMALTASDNARIDEFLTSYRQEFDRTGQPAPGTEDIALEEAAQRDPLTNILSQPSKSRAAFPGVEKFVRTIPGARMVGNVVIVPDVTTARTSQTTSVSRGKVSTVSTSRTVTGEQDKAAVLDKDIRGAIEARFGKQVAGQVQVMTESEFGQVQEQQAQKGQQEFGSRMNQVFGERAAAADVEPFAQLKTFAVDQDGGQTEVTADNVDEIRNSGTPTVQRVEFREGPLEPSDLDSVTEVITQAIDGGNQGQLDFVAQTVLPTFADKLIERGIDEGLLVPKGAGKRRIDLFASEDAGQFIESLEVVKQAQSLSTSPDSTVRDVFDIEPPTLAELTDDFRRHAEEEIERRPGVFELVSSESVENRARILTLLEASLEERLDLEGGKLSTSQTDLIDEVLSGKGPFKWFLYDRPGGKRNGELTAIATAIRAGLGRGFEIPEQPSTQLPSLGARFHQRGRAQP